ncbi:hypothetical protein ID866_4024 [Astraeus odoratus]|nr:hypothetical protein ID866_4024 [Astraeus odoratus]
MDNPWASAWEEPPSDKPLPWASPSDEPVPEQETDLGLPSWPLHDTTQWSCSVHVDPPLWSSSTPKEPEWTPSPSYEQITLSRCVTAGPEPASQDESEPTSAMFSFRETESPKYGSQPMDRNRPQSAQPIEEASIAVPETDVPGGTSSGPPVPSDDEEPDAWADSTILTGPDDEWSSAWNTALSAEDEKEAAPPLDEWETARVEKERFDRAVPPEFLDSILRQCQEALDDIWPNSETVESDGLQDSWRKGLNGLENVNKLLDELIPNDVVLPPPVQFPTTATAKAMNDALKLTRHLPLAGCSPLAKLLASKGSMDWQRSVILREEVVDATPIGWRVLHKEEHRSSVEDTKPKKAAGGLLSFWNRRVSSIPSPPEESRETSPSRRTSIGSNAKSASTSQPEVKRDASPSKRSSTSTPPLPVGQPMSSETVPAPTVQAPSAVSRFLNRFTRARNGGSSLALSADDLEYLSDIVPSASDPDDEQDDLKELSRMVNSSPHPAKVPPPLPPPPKPPATSSSVLKGRPLTSLALPKPSSQPNQSSSPMVLPPPLTPMSAMPLSRSSSPIVPVKHPTTQPLNSSALIFSTPSVSSITKLPPPQLSSPRPQSPFTLPPPPKAPTPLSLPSPAPPPISPSQTPRPGVAQPRPTFTSSTTPSSSSQIWSKSTAPSNEGQSDGSLDDDFFSFTSAPYRRTHAPSDSASILSPESQSSGDQLRSARSSISQPFDDFDDFVSSPSQQRSSIRTPSPPPLPSKNNSPANHRVSSRGTRSSVQPSDHQRTLSLLEQANATKGIWPSPAGAGGAQIRLVIPQPIVEDLLEFEDVAIPSALASPPVRQPVGLTTNAGLVGTGMSSPFNTPLVPQTRGGIGQPSPSPPPSPTSQPLGSFPSYASMSSPPPLATKPLQQPSSRPSQTGGLSAQDLSFFEGL